MVHANNPQNRARHQVGFTVALIMLISAATVVTIPIRLASAETVALGWSYTGSLNTPRYYHTATLLPDGKVLVSGGPSNYIFGIQKRRRTHVLPISGNGRGIVVRHRGKETNFPSFSSEFRS